MTVRRACVRRVLAAAVVGVALTPTAPSAIAKWSGALTGATVDTTHTYTNTTNWVGGTIDDSFSGVTLTGSTTLFFDADRIAAAGLNLGYGGNFDLTLRSDSTTTRIFTLNGDITGDFGGSNDRTANIGTTANALILDLNGATRTFGVSDSGDVLNIANAVQNTGAAAGITKTGSGRLNLSGASAYSGTTTLSAGTIRIGTSTVVASGAITTGPVGIGTLALNGGTLQDNGTTRTLANPITIGGNVAFSSSGTTGLIFDGSSLATPATITLSGTPTLTVNNTVTIRDAVLGTTFTKAGAGTLVLDTDLSGTVSGTITSVTANDGTLTFNRATAIPTAAARSVIAAAGGAVTTSGSLTFDQSFLDRIDIASDGVAALPATSSANLDFSAFANLRLGATGSFTYSGTLTPNGNVYRLGGGGGTLTVTSLLASGNALNVGSSGTTTGFVTLNNASNAFSGITVDGGSLNLPADGAAGSATSNLGAVPATPTDNITLLNGGLLRYVAGSTLTTTRSIVLGTGGGGFDTNGNNISITNAISGSGGLVKTGAGTLTLPGSSLTFGGLTVTGGTVNLSATTTTFNGPVTIAANAPGIVIVPAGSSFEMNSAASVFSLGTRTTVANNIDDQFDASAAQSVSITTSALQLGTTSGAPDHTGTGPFVTFTLPTGASTSSTINAGTSIHLGLGENNGSGLTTLNLGGGTNTIRTPLITLGEDKTGATFQFPAGSGGSLSLAETGSDGKTDITIGENPTASTGTNPTSKFDLTTTGTVTASLGKIILCNTSNNSNPGGGSNATFTLGASGPGSVVTADTVSLGVNTTGTTSLTTSTFNLTAGSFIFNSTGTGFVAGTGTVTVRNSAINVSGGVLDMNGKPINAVANGTGGTSTLAITGGVVANASTIGNFTTFTFSGGTLRDAGTISRGVTQTGSNSLLQITSAIAGTGTTISGDYAITGGAASVAAGKTLSIAGNLSLDPASGGTLGVDITGTSSGKYALTTAGGKIGLTSTTSDKLVVTPLSDITTSTTYTIATFPGGYATGDADFEQVVLSGDIATQDTNSSQANYVLVMYNPTSIDITVNNVSAVPEPATAGLAGAAFIGLLARRRRGRRS